MSDLEHKRGLKILMHHRIASFDGQAIHLRKLAASLQKTGCEIQLVGPPVVTRIAPGEVLPGVEALRRRLPRLVYEALEFAYSGFALVRLLWAWAWFRPDVIYERFNLFQPSGLWLKRLTGSPLMVEVNAPLLEERDQLAPISLRRLANWSEHSVLVGADRLLTVSRTLAQMLASTGISPKKIVVIPNGADDPSNTNISPVNGATAFHGRTVIGFVGFVRAWHKLDWLFDLVSREGSRRNLHLLVVGDGEGLSAAADLLGDRVTITGAVPPDDVSKFLNEMDIAVQPSATPYSSPIKIFEYMAHGRAIVAPDMPNFREILDRDCALFFDPQDQAAFEAAILHLCDHPALRASMGEAARQSYLSRRLSWENAAERVKLAALDCLSQHLQADAVRDQCS